MPFSDHDVWSAVVVLGIVCFAALAVPVGMVFDPLAAGLLLFGFGCMVLLGLLSTEPPVKRYRKGGKRDEQKR